LDLFAALSWCGHGVASLRPAISGPLGPILTLFLAGFVGSPAHCAAMCGPLVLGQVSDRLTRVPLERLGPMTRLGQGMLLPYHFGRLITYSALGAATGWLGNGLVRVPWMRWTGAALLLCAAIVFLVAALRSLVPGLNRVLPPRAGPNLALPITRLVKGLDTTTVTGTFVLGLALGFLPCGFLYTGLVVAAGTASPLEGALALAAFALGTMPSLIVVGIAGHFAGHRLNAGALRYAPIIMLINAVMLAGIGLQRLAPLL
jgi:uncharacterized protein